MQLTGLVFRIYRNWSNK